MSNLSNRTRGDALPTSARHLRLGVDLGATRIKVVVVEVDASGEVALRFSAQYPTAADEGPSAVAERLAGYALDAVAEVGRVVGAGVGIPGLYRASSGEIEFLPNMPGAWRGFRLREYLTTLWRVPVVLINDARAFTLAEARLGAGKGHQTVVGVTVGTGIGGGLVVDGRLLMGSDGRRGEVGHQIVEVDGPLCTCGGFGCVEALAGSLALMRATGLASLDEIYAAAERGEKEARAAVTTAAKYLAAGIANVVTLLRPERVVIGGGAASASRLLIASLRDMVARRAALVDAETYEIVAAELGPVAGAIGAALWSAEIDSGMCMDDVNDIPVSNVTRFGTLKG